MASVRRPIFVGLLIGDLNMDRRDRERRPRIAIICSGRGAPSPGAPLTANAVAAWFLDLYSRPVDAVTAGDSLRDVQDMLGHANLNTTQRYLEPSSNAKRKLVDLI